MSRRHERRARASQARRARRAQQVRDEMRELRALEEDLAELFFRDTFTTGSSVLVPSVMNDGGREIVAVANWCKVEPDERGIPPKVYVRNYGAVLRDRARDIPIGLYVTRLEPHRRCFLATFDPLCPDLLGLLADQPEQWTPVWAGRDRIRVFRSGNERGFWASIRDATQKEYGGREVSAKGFMEAALDIRREHTPEEWFARIAPHSERSF